MVVYRATPSDKPPTYDASLFTKKNPVAAWIEYDTGGARPLRLEIGQVVREIDLAVLQADMANDRHLGDNRRTLSEIAAISGESPKTTKLNEAVTNVIQDQINKYLKGIVRYRGKWIDRAEYNKSVQSDETEMAAIVQRRQNLKDAYKAAVVKPLLEDYDSFTLRTGKNDSMSIEGFKAESSTTLGQLDTGLRERSKPLPATATTNMGIYPSDSADGPAVLWAARGDHLVGMDLGICIHYSQSDNRLLNKAELEQAKFFLSKYDPTLFETVVDSVIASRVQAVLKPNQALLADSLLTLQKRFHSSAGGAVRRETVMLIGKLNTKKGEFTMLQKETSLFKAVLLVGKPSAMNDGTVRQFIIVQLR